MDMRIQIYEIDWLKETKNVEINANNFEKRFLEDQNVNILNYNTTNSDVLSI